MLQIKCDHCGQTLKGKEVKVTTFDAYVENVKYKDYAVTCSKCGGSVVYEYYAKKAAENKAKAVSKAACKTGKSIKQITKEEKYSLIMRKASKRAKEIAKSNDRPLRVQHLSKAIDELPKDEKDIVLAQEDKQDMALLKAGTKKPTKHVKPNSILLLTQAIIELAIAEKDEDFFQSEYGNYIVDAYNTALTNHKCHDYGITAALLLEKMHKGELIKGEDDDDC